MLLLEGTSWKHHAHAAGARERSTGIAAPPSSDTLDFRLNHLSDFLFQRRLRQDIRDVRFQRRIERAVDRGSSTERLDTTHTPGDTLDG